METTTSLAIMDMLANTSIFPPSIKGFTDSTDLNITEDTNATSDELSNVTRHMCHRLNPEAHAQYPYNMLGFTAACAFIIAVLGTFGNLLTIIALPMCKKLRTTATAFVVNLALVELLFCMFILPMSGAQYMVLQLTDEPLLTDRDCVFFAVTRYTLTQVELQTILGIALTRALAVSMPKFYSVINRPTFMACYISGIWAYSFLLKIPTALGYLGHYKFNPFTMECDMDGARESRMVMLLVEAVIPVLVIIVLYIFVFVMVKLSSARVQRASQRGSKKVPPAPTSTTSNASNPTSNASNNNTPSNGNQRKGSNSSFKSLKRMVSESSLRARLIGAAQHLNLRRTHQSSTVSQRLSTSRRDMRVARTIFIIFVFVLVCSVPVAFVHMVDPCVLRPVRFLALHILYWLQYCLNLFVYVLLNRQYRDAYVDCLSRVFPQFKRHHGRRLFWEKPSVSSKPAPQLTSTRPRLDSANNANDSIASCDGDSVVPAAPGGPVTQPRLSAIPEGHSSSAANDSVFSDPVKKDGEEMARMPEEMDHSEEENEEPHEEQSLVTKNHWLNKEGATAQDTPEDEDRV